VSDDALHDATVGEYGEKDSPYAALAEELYRERVLRARRTPPEEKLLAGQRLFEWACEITLAGIRNDFPGESAERHQQILRDRLKLRRKREAAG
jgi:hypothetical protein